MYRYNVHRPNKNQDQLTLDLNYPSNSNSPYAPRHGRLNTEGTCTNIVQLTSYDYTTYLCEYMKYLAYFTSIPNLAGHTLIEIYMHT